MHLHKCTKIECIYKPKQKIYYEIRTNFKTTTIKKMTDFDEDDDLKDKLNGLINDLCLSGLKLLDQDKLKQIKSICK